ncbi:MAG: AmmeMemoRadiSam system protein B [Acidimicrobiia bacterium]|nr:AmmeMemoRadiSam system protein B [Acidimicrobiia bacterium]MDH5615726.1 AmmeMemoRadiSam system protein B [Acidimicrobiia bacterium]
MKPGRLQSSIRSPAVAGTFYPSDPEELRLSVDGMLAAATVPETAVTARILIVPHAGYVYSGPVAATAYRLMQTAACPRRLVVVGPSHFVAFTGLATPGVEGLATPLGVVPVDAELTAIAESRAAAAPNRAAHVREHSVEVQLPFLQEVLGQFAVLALLTGAVEPETVAEVLGELMKAEGVVAVISSDLSHYLDYNAALAQDARTARAIVALHPDDLGRDDACGLVGVQAVLQLARKEGWKCSLLDLRSSGDTAGGRDAVVGYGSFVIGPAR